MPSADQTNLVRLAHNQVAAGGDAMRRHGLCCPSTFGPGLVSNLEVGVPVIHPLAGESPADAMPNARLTHPWRRLIRGVLPLLPMCQDTQQRRAWPCGPPCVASRQLSDCGNTKRNVLTPSRVWLRSTCYNQHNWTGLRQQHKHRPFPSGQPYLIQYETPPLPDDISSILAGARDVSKRRWWRAVGLVARQAR